MGQGYLLERNNVLARLHACDTLAHGLDDASSLVSQDNGEGSLRVLSGQRVGIGVADTGVVDLDPDLMSFGRGNFDILDDEVLAGLPGDGGLSIIWSIWSLLFVREHRESANLASDGL